MSTGLTSGGATKSSSARPKRAFAISPLTCALLPSSSANVSNIPNVAGATLNANHDVVPVSASTSGPQNARIALPRLLCRVGPATLLVIRLCSPELSFVCCGKPFVLPLSVARRKRSNLSGATDTSQFDSSHWSLEVHPPQRLHREWVALNAGGNGGVFGIQCRWSWKRTRSEIRPPFSPIEGLFEVCRL
jgi:hypothetical protein